MIKPPSTSLLNFFIQIRFAQVHIEPGKDVQAFSCPFLGLRSCRGGTDDLDESLDIRFVITTFPMINVLTDRPNTKRFGEFVERFSFKMPFGDFSCRFHVHRVENNLPGEHYYSDRLQFVNTLLRLLPNCVLFRLSEHL